MNTVSYDGSFEGFLTAVFEVYEYKITLPHFIKANTGTASLFGSIHNVQSSRDKALRVSVKLKAKLSSIAFANLYKTFLSEIQDIENVMYRYIFYVLSTDNIVENNYANPDVLLLQQTAKKVHREKHRMEAFVRFQLTKDQLFYCIIQPDFNVLPLIAGHFEKRYADQRWLIYDSRRNYGLYYDLQQTNEITLAFSQNINDDALLKTICDEKEELYQMLWRQYFSSVNIAARKNMKLHIQHIPKRYWRYLTEKKPA